MDVMRDTMIYFRNNPSILFWEAGNTVITVEHMQQMVALRKELGSRRPARDGRTRQRATMPPTPPPLPSPNTLAS